MNFENPPVKARLPRAVAGIPGYSLHIVTLMKKLKSGGLN